MIGIGKVDGFDSSTNTVYEYHGSYWHGNPEVFDPNDINEMAGKTFGELYQSTISRDRQILQLIIKWED